MRGGSIFPKWKGSGILGCSSGERKGLTARLNTAAAVTSDCSGEEGV